MTTLPGLSHLRDREPPADQLVALQAVDVLPVGIGMVHHAQMDAVHLVEIAVDVAAEDDLGHLILLKPDLLFQLAEQGVNDVLPVVQMAAKADAGLSLQALLPADPGRHEESPGGLVLHQHIWDHLLEERITLRLTAKHRRQILVDSVSKRDFPAVFLPQRVLLTGKSILL